MSLWLLFLGTCAEQCKPQRHFQPCWHHVISLHVCGSVSHSVQTRYKGSFLHPTVDCDSRFRFVSHHDTPVDSKASYICALDQCSSVFYTPGASFIHWFVQGLHLTPPEWNAALQFSFSGETKTSCYRVKHRPIALRTHAWYSACELGELVKQKYQANIVCEWLTVLLYLVICLKCFPPPLYCLHQ